MLTYLFITIIIIILILFMYSYNNIHFIKKKDRDYQTSDLPKSKFESIKKQLNGYVVISEDSDVVITVGHKYKRRRS